MRTSISAVAPKGFQKVLDLDAYVEANVDPALLVLVKLRASILNGCSFCTDMHATHGTEAGEPARKLFAVGAWRDAPFFDKRERAALALTEAATRLGDHGVSDEVWDEARAHFSEKELSDLILAIATINVWNRIAVTTRLQPPAA